MSVDIYILTSPSGKQYVGKSINVETRLISHFKNTIKQKTKFGNALKKYVEEKCQIDIISCKEEQNNFK